MNKISLIFYWNLLNNPPPPQQKAVKVGVLIVAVLNHFDNMLICNQWRFRSILYVWRMLSVLKSWREGCWGGEVTDLLGCSTSPQDCYHKRAPQGKCSQSCRRVQGGRPHLEGRKLLRTDSCPSRLKIFCAQLRNRQILSRDIPIQFIGCHHGIYIYIR